MRQLAADFRDESDALHALVEPLSAKDMQRPTAFKQWTPDMILRHLHVWNLAAGMSLAGDGSFQTYYAALSEHLKGGGAFPVFEEAWLDGLSGPDLVAVWRDGCRTLADSYAEAQPSARVKWAGPDMSVRSSLTARLMETWAHGQAIYDLLGVVRENRDRIRNIVVLGYNTYAWSFRVHGREPPTPQPQLILSAPSGEIWTFGEPNALERIEGPAEAFCQVVTQTRNVADTDLATTGPNAAAWMEIAQCFAGAPVLPPAPGLRRTGASGAPA
ncbi:MAG: TIGR03084 family metal-binding protein [Hyphomonadaceae bacterium]